MFLICLSLELVEYISSPKIVPLSASPIPANTVAIWNSPLTSADAPSSPLIPSSRSCGQSMARAAKLGAVLSIVGSTCDRFFAE